MTCPAGLYNTETGHFWNEQETRFHCPYICPNGMYSERGAASSADCHDPPASHKLVVEDWSTSDRNRVDVEDWDAWVDVEAWDSLGDSVLVGVDIVECPQGPFNEGGGRAVTRIGRSPETSGTVQVQVQSMD